MRRIEARRKNASALSVGVGAVKLLAHASQARLLERIEQGGSLLKGGDLPRVQFGGQKRRLDEAHDRSASRSVSKDFGAQELKACELAHNGAGTATRNRGTFDTILHLNCMFRCAAGERNERRRRLTLSQNIGPARARRGVRHHRNEAAHKAGEFFETLRALNNYLE